MKMNKLVVRHGDVLIELYNGEIPSESKKRDGKVLFWGEKTGHRHSIDVGEIFETKNGDLYLRVDKLTKVTHEEHKTVTLPKGVYRVRQKRQYASDGGWERVCD